MSLPRNVSFATTPGVVPFFGRRRGQGEPRRMLALLVSCVAIGNISAAEAGLAGADSVTVKPLPYEQALRNPLEGLTTRNLGTHKWATLAHHYIAWDEIEAQESDGVEKIRAFCDLKWQGFAERNIKVIPRVYLEYPGQDRKHWPADLKTDDYESVEFARRLARFVEKLGQAWDEDPRVAFVELGLFGKWGEHHSPSPVPAIQKIAAEAFRKAFPHKLVSVRQAWVQFPDAAFGEYWDSFAHYDQMRDDGAAMAALNQSRRRYETQYIGGEVAYDWGNWRIQPGVSPTETLSVPMHREFMANTMRWLHCTQLRWITDYEPGNAAAEAGAEEIQKALGYRFTIDEATFSPTVGEAGDLRVQLKIRNLGSAPFYYRWPLEVSLLSPDDHQVVWRATFAEVDIRTWLPGDGWTAPSWKPSGVAGRGPEAVWPALADCAWSQPPKTYVAGASFKPVLPAGQYILAVAIVDPAGQLPSVRFATANYLQGGRHPLGIVGIGGRSGGSLPSNFAFDDPQADQSLHYVASVTPPEIKSPTGRN